MLCRHCRTPLALTFLDLGSEPSRSTARADRDKGIPIIERFFGMELAGELTAKGRSADLMVANNVLAHVPEINDFVAGFARLLKPHGIATFEFPHLLRMVMENQFDTVYHEHYSYLSLATVDHVFTANGLEVFDVEELPTHGGSLRVFARRADTGEHEISSRVAALMARENRAGMGGDDFYAGFQVQAEKVKNDFLEFLVRAKRQGKTVAAYGAAAKSNTLLNFAGLRPDLLPYVADKNPARQGKFLPGSRIPIVAEENLRTRLPDYIVILPWNIKAEIMEQPAYAGQWGARFVTAVPELLVERQIKLPESGYPG